MRALIANEKGEDEAWVLKLASGGLMDVESVAQFLVLAHGGERRAFARPRPPNSRGGGERGFWTRSAETLLQALTLYGKVTQWQRLALEVGADPRKAAEGVRRRIAIAGGLPGFALLERELATTRKDVRKIFPPVPDPRSLGGAHSRGGLSGCGSRSAPFTDGVWRR